MKKLILALFIFSSIQVFAQEEGTYYFDKDGQLCDHEIAKEAWVIKKENRKTFIQNVYEFNSTHEKLTAKHTPSEYIIINNSTIEMHLFEYREIEEYRRIVYDKTDENNYSYKVFNADHSILESGTAINIMPLIRNGKIKIFSEDGETYKTVTYNRNKNLTADSMRIKRFENQLIDAGYYNYSPKILTNFFFLNYFSDNKEPCTENNASRKTTIHWTSKGHYQQCSYTKNNDGWEKNPNYYKYEVLEDSTIKIDSYTNTLLTSTKYRHIYKENDSLYKYFDFTEDTLISEHGTASCIFPMIYEGTVTRISSQRYVSEIAEYRNNKLISNKRWTEMGEKAINNVFAVVDLPPSFADGEEALFEFLQKNIFYPQEAKEKNIQGTIFIRFIVMENGEIEEVEVLRGVHPSLDNEALRVVNLTSGKWSPGKINGEPIRTWFVFPIKFVLQG